SAPLRLCVRFFFVCLRVTSCGFVFSRFWLWPPATCNFVSIRGHLPRGRAFGTCAQNSISPNKINIQVHPARAPNAAPVRNKGKFSPTQATTATYRFTNSKNTLRGMSFLSSVVPPAIARGSRLLRNRLHRIIRRFLGDLDI